MPERKEWTQRARIWLEAHKQEMLNDLCEFIACPSVSRADLAQPGAPFGAVNARMLQLALLRAAAYGFLTTNAEGHYGKVMWGNDDNSIGIIAHLDVVPAGPNWIHSPFAPTLEGDYLFGRGSGDNKGSAIMALYVMRAIQELGIPMKHGLRLILGMSEETGMQDAPAYNRNERPCAVTLVPDAGYPVCYAQKGSLNAHVAIAKGAEIRSFSGGEVDNMVPPTAECTLNLPAARVSAVLAEKGFRAPDFTVEGDETRATVRAFGAASHAAAPQNGKSAIHMLAEALDQSRLLSGESAQTMAAIAALSAGYYGEQMNIACEDPDTGKTTMVVGVARTEGEEIGLHIDCRLSVAADIPAVQANLQASAQELGFALRYITSTAPSFIPRDDARVEALMRVYREMTGDSTPAYTMGGGTYSRCLTNAITFGLGRPDQKMRPEGLPAGHGGAHGPDEYIYVPSLIENALIYLNAILALDEIV